LIAPLLALSLTVAAQGLKLPGMPALPTGTAAAPGPAASAPTLTDWTARLDAARARHGELLALPEGSEPLLAQRLLPAARLVVLISAEIDALKARASGSRQAGRAPITVQSLPGPAPYSVLAVDALRDQLDMLTVEQTNLRLSLKTVDAKLESLVQARDEAVTQLRLRQDERVRAGQGDDATEQAARAELAGLMSQVAELELLQADESRQRAREQLAALEAPIAKLQAEIDRVRTQMRFDEPDFARIVKDLAAQRQRLTTETAKLTERLARGASGRGDDAQGEVETDALSQALKGLHDLDAMARTTEVLWQERRAMLQTGFDGQARRAAATRQEDWLRALHERRTWLGQEMRLVRSEVRSRQAGLATMGVGDPLRATEQRELEALQLQLDVQERLRDAVDRNTALLTRMRADLGVADLPGSPREWLERAWEMLVQGAGAVWQYELFSATETTDVNGRPVTIDHGVTVGKSVGVLLLFALGYWVAGWASRGLIAVMARRLQLTPQLARVLRRWVNAILVVVVLLLVLKLARIPITAFAFLGGALAIGIGFGAQNVIKNLISGIIILFERKIRVGDVVSIGGMAGTVVTVDLRATTVRGFDGIDAIVPNSALLENQISNWSGGSLDVRRVVTVGVAYGTDLRQAAKIVADCASAHASVLQEPAPEVLLDDFGGDDIKLKLQYWTRLGGLRGGPSVDSDLRFAIAEAFRDAGIAMAFPQRDVHLDVAAPLRVELTGSAAGPTARSSTPE
jgi:small-conductance mechanosensitive channel